MKLAISFLLAFSIIINFSYSQSTTNSNSQLDRKFYLKKGKNQKIAAWILLGAGVISIAAVTPSNTNLNTTSTVVVVGGASILGSIPLFIAASRNKRKARNMSAYFKVDKENVDLTAIGKNIYLPTLSLRFIL